MEYNKRFDKNDRAAHGVSKSESRVFSYLAAEVVTLYHAKFVHLIVTDTELKPGHNNGI